jgi:uncharacterized protein YktA (UPF0223 family)
MLKGFEEFNRIFDDDRWSTNELLDLYNTEIERIYDEVTDEKDIGKKIDGLMEVVNLSRQYTATAISYCIQTIKDN